MLPTETQACRAASGQFHQTSSSSAFYQKTRLHIGDLVRFCTVTYSIRLPGVCRFRPQRLQTSTAIHQNEESMRQQFEYLRLCLGEWSSSHGKHVRDIFCTNELGTETTFPKARATKSNTITMSNQLPMMAMDWKRMRQAEERETIAKRRTMYPSLFWYGGIDTARKPSVKVVSFSRNKVHGRRVMFVANQNCELNGWLDTNFSMVYQASLLTYCLPHIMPASLTTAPCPSES